jgi:hypothetical protein
MNKARSLLISTIRSPYSTTEPTLGRECLSDPDVAQAPTVDASLTDCFAGANAMLVNPPGSHRLASVPRWRAACRVRGHKLVSHAEQLPQYIGCDAGQANQHVVVVEIVVGHVVNIWSVCEQLGAVVEVNPNRKRTRLGRAMSRHACQEFSVNLERG